MAFFFKFRYSLFLSCFYDRIRERKGWDLDMQRESIRMYAYAIDFDLIKVDLSLNYYNGIVALYIFNIFERIRRGSNHFDLRLINIIMLFIQQLDRKLLM